MGVLFLDPYLIPTVAMLLDVPPKMCLNVGSVSTYLIYTSEMKQCLQSFFVKLLFPDHFAWPGSQNDPTLQVLKRRAVFRLVWRKHILSTEEMCRYESLSAGFVRTERVGLLDPLHVCRVWGVSPRLWIAAADICKAFITELFTNKVTFVKPPDSKKTPVSHISWLFRCHWSMVCNTTNT